MLLGYNNRVAVEPFPQTSIEVKVNSGFAVASQKTNLTALKVVHAAMNTDINKALLPGDTIYVRGETAAHVFAKEVFEVGGSKFILCPLEMVVMVDKAIPGTSPFSWTYTESSNQSLPASSK